MKHSETISRLAASLVAVQAEIRGVAKDSSNTEFRSQYTSLDAILAVVRPVLTKHGLAIVQGATTPHSDENGRIAAIAVETMLIHSTGEWLTNTAIMPVVGRMLKGGGRADVDPQAGGSALTYGRRYGIAALLCLAADEDDDGNAASRAKASAVRGNGRATESNAGSRAAEGLQPPGASRLPATAQPLTRNSALTFGAKYRDWRVAELPDDYLLWAIHGDRKPTAFGASTAAWQQAFRDELKARNDGAVAREARPELAGV